MMGLSVLLVATLFIFFIIPFMLLQRLHNHQIQTEVVKGGEVTSLMNHNHNIFDSVSLSAEIGTVMKDKDKDKDKDVIASSSSEEKEKEKENEKVGLGLVNPNPNPNPKPDPNPKKLLPDEFHLSKDLKREKKKQINELRDSNSKKLYAKSRAAILLSNRIDLSDKDIIFHALTIFRCLQEKGWSIDFLFTSEDIMSKNKGEP